MKQINKLIDVICYDLDIDKPKIKMVDDLQGSILAYYNPQNNELVIKRKYIDLYDVYFVIMHELRHKYQVDNGLFNFGAYKLRYEVDSLREYNLQHEEIDANAYAYYMMIMLFDRQPLFNGLDDDIKAKIEARALEIDNE